MCHNQSFLELDLHGERPPYGDHDDPLGEVHADEEGRLAHIDMEGGVHDLDVLVAEDLSHGGHVAVAAVVPHHDAVLCGHHTAVSAAAPGRTKPVILCTHVHYVSSHLVSPVQTSSPGARQPLELAKVAEVDGEVCGEDGVLDYPKGLGILGRTEGV